jgi:hypothetical protein
MAWDDRLKEAAYTSPSGNRFVFLYENVSKEVDKKTTEFLFPEKDGAFIQDLGRAGRRYPFMLFFSGPDYDLLSDAFLEALEEKGAGKLEHPRYGDKIVIPTGRIVQREDLTTAANQAVFSVVFSETIEDITFPISAQNTGSILSASANNFQIETADQFQADIKIDNSSEGVFLQNVALASVPIIDSLEEITEQDSDINASFKTILAAYEEQVKNVLLELGDTALQAILLIRTPSRIKTDIKNEVDIYTTFINSLISVIQISDGTNNPDNTYLYINTMAATGLTALCEAALFSVIETRPQAVEASQNILDLYDALKLWQDQNITALEIVDSGETYNTLTQVVSEAVIYLVNVSFDLPQERIEILQNDRNLIEFLASVGLNVESNFDNFIQWNDLTADEIEILPKDLEVIYYV